MESLLRHYFLFLFAIRNWLSSQANEATKQQYIEQQLLI